MKKLLLILANRDKVMSRSSVRFPLKKIANRCIDSPSYSSDAESDYKIREK